MQHGVCMSHSAFLTTHVKGGKEYFESFSKGPPKLAIHYPGPGVAVASPLSHTPTPMPKSGAKPTPLNRFIVFYLRAGSKTVSKSIQDQSYIFQMLTWTAAF